MSNSRLSHLDALEAESIQILREVAAEFSRPAMLYSIGKDSSVMLRLAQKAFYPAAIPFPLLHIDTTYKFREMIEFRDRICRELGVKLIVHTNTEAIEAGANPFRLGTTKCCALLKTKDLNCGTFTTAESTKGRACGSSRSPTGRNSMSGNISGSKRFPLSLCI